MLAEHFRRLKEVSQCFEDGLNQVFLVEIDRLKYERNKVWVFLQDLDRMSGLSQIVYRHHCVSFETWNVGLEETLNDWVELVVVCIYVTRREVLDHHAQKQHGELFVIDRLCLAVREHELEQFVPLFVWYQDHCERANHIGDVLLHDRSRLCDIALQ